MSKREQAADALYDKIRQEVEDAGSPSALRDLAAAFADVAGTRAGSKPSRPVASSPRGHGEPDVMNVEF